MTSKKVIVVFIALISANVALGQRIVEVQTLTGAMRGADMDDWNLNPFIRHGDLDLQICSKLQCCKITRIDNYHDNFERGMIDTFRRSNLQKCQNFKMESGAPGWVEVSQSGYIT